MKRPMITLTLLLATAVAAVAQDSARYTVTFHGTWSAETHPDDFPLLAHFSPLIGVTHDGSFDVATVGKTATNGLEKLSEEGKHQPFDAEIKKALDTGAAGTLIETMEPIRDLPGMSETTFSIDAKHPMVSIVAMIAPSPDWFAGAIGVTLREGDGWVSERTVNLEAYDAGTDSATTYRALDADMDPRGRIQPNASPYFAGDRRVVGTLTFKRK